MAHPRCALAYFAAVTAILIGSAALGAERRPAGKFRFHKLGHKVVLAREGRPRVVIVVTDGAPAPVRFAGDELKEHLDLMTGGSFQVVKTIPADGKAIVLGDCAQARVAGIDVTRIARDGYAIRTVRDTIFIAGPDDTTARSEVLLSIKKPFPRRASRYAMEQAIGAATWDFNCGTLYGVYRVLEELGVRWFFAGAKGRVVPERGDVDVPALSMDEEPVYLLRKVGTPTWQWYFLDSPRIRRMVNRQEYEDLGWDGNAVRLWFLRMRHSSEWFAFNHRPPRAQLEQRYGREHPEYFAVRPSGARDLAPETGRTGHLCYTHPGVAEITKRDIDAYFAGKTGEEMGFSAHSLKLNPFNRGWSANAFYGRTVSLLPHDSFRGCECANCLKLTHKDRDRPHWHSELVWRFVVNMAQWMEQAHPDKLIICLAYASYSEKPDFLDRLPENVVVGMCPANYARTANIVDEKSYADLFRMVGEWSRLNERPMLIWLHHLYRYRRERRIGMPMLLTGLWGRLFRDLAEHANLMHIEMDPDSPMLEHLNHYVMLKLLYNPNLDPAALVDDYCRSLYGPGAKIVRPMLADIEARCAAMAKAQANNIDAWEKHFTEDVMKGYREQTDALLRGAKRTRHEEPARLFSTYFVGAMERGRALYVRNVKEVAKSREANVSIRQLVGKIKVDGELDEPGWERSSRRTFISNVDGQKTKWPTEVRFLRAAEHLYFGFTCHDPNTPQLSDKLGEADSVEIFLDPDHDHDSDYFLQIDLAGRVTYEQYFQGGGEPPDKTWKSGLRCAVKRYEDRWVVEAELPRKGIRRGLDRPEGRPWGANFCRTTFHPPRPEDQFSCWSPLIRGRFHQPDLFGHIFFVK